jgi:hypothetical protein
VGDRAAGVGDHPGTAIEQLIGVFFCLAMACGFLLPGCFPGFWVSVKPGLAQFDRQSKVNRRALDATGRVRERVTPCPHLFATRSYLTPALG